MRSRIDHIYLLALFLLWGAAFWALYCLHRISPDVWTTAPGSGVSVAVILVSITFFATQMVRILWREELRDIGELPLNRPQREESKS